MTKYASGILDIVSRPGGHLTAEQIFWEMKLKAVPAGDRLLFAERGGIVGSMGQYQHHIGLGYPGDLPGLPLRQHPDPLVGLAEPFRQHIPTAQPGRGGHDLRQPHPGVGEQPDLGVDAAGRQRRRGIVAMGRYQQGVVPGQRHRGEGQLQRARRGDHPAAQPGRPYAAHHPVEQRIAGGDHNRQRLLVERL